MFIQYAKFVMTILLCIIYLPFSITDLYFGIFAENECMLKKNEIPMKDYLLLSGYGELSLLIISILMISTPSNVMTNKLIQIYYIIYGGIYTIYTIWNIFGIYLLYIYNNCLYEYILISLTIKVITTCIIISIFI